jgi:hypothetical protein
MIKILSVLLVFVRVMTTAATAQTAPVLTGPLVDPDRLVSDSAAAQIRKAAEAFKEATGHWMVFVVTENPLLNDFQDNPEIRFAPWETTRSRTPVGIVYAMSPNRRLGRLLVISPHWRAVATAGWIPMFPQRLLQKYGDEGFETRATKSAQYFADVFPDKIAFLLRPDTGPISEESTAYARWMMKGVEYFCYFIILFTFYRTFWPARVRDEDTDDFSNELRRLKKERQIW